MMGDWFCCIKLSRVSIRGLRAWFTTMARKICAGFGWIFFMNSVGKGKEGRIEIRILERLDK